MGRPGDQPTERPYPYIAQCRQSVKHTRRETNCDEMCHTSPTASSLYNERASQAYHEVAGEDRNRAVSAVEDDDRPQVDQAKLRPHARSCTRGWQGWTLANGDGR